MNTDSSGRFELVFAAFAGLFDDVHASFWRISIQNLLQTFTAPEVQKKSAPSRSVQSTQVVVEATRGRKATSFMAHVP